MRCGRGDILRQTTHKQAKLQVVLLRVKAQYKGEVLNKVSR